jgi:transposase InsO family protein
MYTINKHMPKLRRTAVQLFRKGWTARKIGRHFGFHHTAVMKWVRKANVIGDHPIPTKSSRPKSHPKELGAGVVQKIVATRLKRRRYAEAIHKELANDGVIVSLSSIKRTLDRKYLLKKKSLWKRYHPHQDRPQVLNAGDLIETDTIHLMIGKKTRMYVFTLIDVHSRWAYAKAYASLSSARGVEFIKAAQQAAPFSFAMIQSDHGPEFGAWFVSRIKVPHRHTRIGKPNDNSHIERFNRTLQEECLDSLKRDPRIINRALKKYLQYYNCERLHGGIAFLTPMQVVPRY